MLAGATGIADVQAIVHVGNREQNLQTRKRLLKDIASNFDDTKEVAAGFQDLKGAYLKNAQLAGAQAGDPQITEAIAAAQRDGLLAQLNAMAVKDPSRALAILDKAIAGVRYNDIANSFRARADQQDGYAYADRKISDQKISGTAQGAEVAGVPGNFVQAVKQFEGFRSRAYWDVKQNTVGWGTRANSPDEVITPEEAECRISAATSVIPPARLFLGGVELSRSTATRSLGG